MTMKKAEKKTSKHSAWKPNSDTKTASAPELTFREKVKIIVRGITIEPMLIVHMAAMMMIFLIAQSLKMYKICRITFHLPMEVCFNLTSNNSLEQEVQKVAANYSLYWTLIQTIPSIVFTMFIGPWSDKHGRKIPMLLPLLGAFLAGVVFLLTAIFEEIPPQFILVGPVVMGSTGGILAFLLAVCSYISDISDTQTRTMRIALLYGNWYLGSPIGSILGGLLKEHYGYVTVFATSCGMLLLCIAYVIIRVKDQVREEDVCAVGDEKKNNVKEFFNLKNISESFQTCLKYRNGNKRMHLWVLIVCLCMLYLPLRGEGNVRYLYMRLKFQWSDSTFSNYTAATRVIGSLGMLLFVLFSTKCAKVSDPVLAIMATIARIISEIIVAFSQVDWLMFIAPLTLIGDSVGAATRSMMTKSVEANEVGKMFTVVTIIEASVPIISGIMYSQVYNATIKIFPGTVFLVTVAFFLIVLVSLSWLAVDMRRQKRMVKVGIDNASFVPDPKEMMEVCVAKEKLKDNDEVLMTGNTVDESTTNDCQTTLNQSLTENASIVPEPKEMLKERLKDNDEVLMTGNTGDESTTNDCQATLNQSLTENDLNKISTGNNDVQKTQVTIKNELEDNLNTTSSDEQDNTEIKQTNNSEEIHTTWL